MSIWIFVGGTLHPAGEEWTRPLPSTTEGCEFSNQTKSVEMSAPSGTTITVVDDDELADGLLYLYNIFRLTTVKPKITQIQRNFAI